MANQIKISLWVDGVEKDYIVRQIPSWHIYNFPKGILVDLSLLLRRNYLLDDWMVELFKKFKLLDS